MSRQYRILDIKMDRFWETLKSDNELLASGDFYRILARVMSFVRNEQIANAIKDTVETYCGNIIPVKGHAASKAAFNEWAKTAGLQSRQSLGELNTELVGVLTWGDCLVVLGKDPYSLPGAISARIKIISPECVQTPPKYLNKGLVEGKKVILGVVLDKHDIELGYYVRMAGTDGSKNEHYEYLPCYDSKTGRFISRLVRRPGSRFPGQVRSFPMLLSSLFSINAIDKLSEFTVKEAQTKSLLAAWLESPANASGAVGLGVNPGVFDMKTGKKLNDDSGEKKEAPKMNISALESGAIPVLESGSKIHSVSNTGNLG